MKITKKMHPELISVMQSVYPNYKGRKFYLVIEDNEINCISYWSEGSRIMYKFVRLDGRVFSLPESHPSIQEHNENRKTKLSFGLACVTHTILYGIDCGLTIMLCSQSVKQIESECTNSTQKLIA
jgi:hypothetical protein